MAPLSPARPVGVILDLDGTICRGNTLIPGAREACAALEQAGHPLVFVTNMVDSPTHVAAILSSQGLSVRPHQVLTSSQMLMAYLVRHVPEAKVFALGEPALGQELASRFRLSEDPAEIDVVVASADSAFDYRKLTIAFQALRRGARFLATNADPTWPTPAGEVPDAGAVIGALEGCTQRRLELVVGKPSVMVAEAALERLARAADETWIVGDSLGSDILMGQQAGMTTVLVLSGVTHREDLPSASIQPNHVLEDVTALPNLLRNPRDPRAV
jgi:HAD superfamily hydrolase (TIGR01450 family)